MSEQTTTQILQPILNRFVAGDKEAKRELVQMAYDRMLILARKILRSFNSVDEETTAILHGSYTRIERALDAVKPKTIRDFLGLVALQIRRELLDLARAGKRTPDAGPVGGGSESSGGLDYEDTGAGADREGVQSDVLTCIAKLPEAQREVVDMLFWMGLTQAEAAEIIGVHEDTVKRTWAKARVLLQECLKSYGPPAA